MYLLRTTMNCSESEENDATKVLAFRRNVYPSRGGSSLPPNSVECNDRAFLREQKRGISRGSSAGPMYMRRRRS